MQILGAFRWPLAALISVTLAGCEDFPGAASQGGGTSPASKIVERDVEAPGVFEASEAGLWDGRPSLGGVWVAYPGVQDPERVIIRNTTNGKFVVGALFRREREAPGPRLQVSSDAAEALGMLAGQPTDLSVTALRKEEAVEVAEGTDALPSSEEIEAVPLEDAAAAAIAEVEAETPDSGTPPAAVEAAVAAAPAEAATEAPAAPPRGSADVAALSKPFIQIGIFSVEDNARRTARQMDEAGLQVRVLEETGGGKPSYRVLVGPAANTTARSEALAQVKGLGFSDAFYVSR